MKKPIYSIQKVVINKNNQKILEVRKVDVHRGSCYVLYGDIGSGKSTFLNLLARIESPAEGEIEFEGASISSMSKANYLKEIYHVPQYISDPWFGVSVESYIKNKLSSHQSIADPNKRFKDIVRNMKIKNYLSRNFKTLSDGEKRWIELSAAIACDTKVLIIDGFGQYLSDEKLRTLSKILYRKVNYDGATLIVGTHIRERLTRIASVFIKLDRGKIVSVRSKSKKNPGRRSNATSKSNTSSKNRNKNKK